ncbi:uncharacterized protein METZ01_LOCUS488882 [marine metagenome]|uniref:Protein TolR n=1 Tax=marine metagenome TaxID=408172 RepID=A0A383CWK2_9ZZZZ
MIISSQKNSKRNKRYSQISEINVTPFVDVMLVLLIVFMVTAPLLTVGIPVDLPKVKEKDALEDGYGITCKDLEEATDAHGVEVSRGDFVIVRTGQMETKLKEGSWDGYPGGDAPGFSFETLEWIQDKQIAGLASDTWGCEVRPNESEEGINQPWHWITIPIMGLTMGEIFYLKELAEDCSEDSTYEFMFVAPALPITGAVGSPINPLAIK